MILRPPETATRVESPGPPSSAGVPEGWKPGEDPTGSEWTSSVTTVGEPGPKGFPSSCPRNRVPRPYTRRNTVSCSPCLFWTPPTLSPVSVSDGNQKCPRGGTYHGGSHVPVLLLLGGKTGPMSGAPGLPVPTSPDPTRSYPSPAKRRDLGVDLRPIGLDLSQSRGEFLGCLPSDTPVPVQSSDEDACTLSGENVGTYNSHCTRGSRRDRVCSVHTPSSEGTVEGARFRRTSRASRVDLENPGTSTPRRTRGREVPKDSLRVQGNTDGG